MGEGVEPALTPEGVVAQVVREHHGVRIVDWNNPGVVLDNPHGTAAALLHGQSWGFTWDDVDLLRESAEAIEGGWGHGDPDAARLLDLADRIEALLPPRDR